MSFLDSISLLLIMGALAALPSASVALVVTRSATRGISHGVAVALGIVLGDIVFILLAILGLSAVAEAMGALFVVLKCMGGAYLIWIGYALFTSQSESVFLLHESGLKGSLAVSFLSGLLLTLGDVKAIVFYGSLFPVFLDVTAVKLSDFLIIILITVATVGGVKIAYAIAANRVVNITQSLGLAKGVKRLAGSVMIGAGSYLIVKA
ncbi:MAG: LysE family translocator [Nitrospirales bacterium]|nr:LysE family translocator [Nitrospirales bacterium]